MNAGIVIYSLGLALLLTGAQVLFKIFATSRGARPGPELQQLVPLFGALALYVIVFVLYAQALRKLELSLLYPTYTALSVLLTYFAGIVLFREQLTLRALAGCLLLVAAIYLIASPRK
jgi:multidrug transporter EmrE-like cation transporter